MEVFLFAIATLLLLFLLPNTGFCHTLSLLITFCQLSLRPLELKWRIYHIYENFTCVDCLSPNSPQVDVKCESNSWLWNTRLPLFTPECAIALLLSEV